MTLSGLAGFARELRRRKVWQVAVTYVIVGAGVIGTGEAAIPDEAWNVIQLPAVLLVLLGLPVALVLAWAYELRPEEATVHGSDTAGKEAAGTSAPQRLAAGVSAEVSDHSIVVLPFDNLSPDPGDEYFSDGLTEELITTLSRVPGLRVISRNSALALRGRGKDTRAIGRELDVRYLLEGSVRKAGDRLRITAQLIDAETDAHLWADRYDGRLADVFDVQDRFARSIVEQVRGRLTPRVEARLAARRTPPDLRVQEAYARARFEFWRTEPGSQERAMRILTDAVRIVGEDPLLLSGIGVLHWQQYHQFGDTDEAHLRNIGECARKIFASEPGSPHAHRLTSYLRLTEGRTEEAIRHLRTAVETDPNDTETLLWLAYMLAFHAGRPAAARPLSERLRSIDPLNHVSCTGAMMVDWMEGDAASALRRLDHMDALDPGNQLSDFYRAHLLASSGRLDEADQVSERLFTDGREGAMGQVVRFLVHALRGRRNEALVTVTKEAWEVIGGDFHLPWIMAEGYAVLGDLPEALTWLERAVDRGLFNYPLLASEDPFLRPLRSEPRAASLIEDVRTRWDVMGRELEHQPILQDEFQATLYSPLFGSSS